MERSFVAAEVNERPHARPADPDLDFTLDHYREILARITSTHRTFSFGEAAPMGEALLEVDRFVLMRHDVEFSLDAALTMARADHDAGVRSTFFVQIGSDYNLFEADGAEAVEEVLDLGHDLGFHYDLGLLERSGGDPVALAGRAIDLIEGFFGTRIRAASPHLPMRSGRTLRIPGIVDAYDPLYFERIKYLSDSTQAWREGVVTSLLDRYDRIQLLTHEYHWTEEGLGWDELLLLEAEFKYRRLRRRAEANVERFREGLRLRAKRDAAFRAGRGGSK
ncbi:MAG: hypothetical protein OXH32_16500 [Acidobacteria bacterium]|nr:hypothetical protein [Acidobacteriota bacterium]